MKAFYSLWLLALSLASAQKIVDVHNKLLFYTNSTDTKVNEFDMFNFKYTVNVSIGVSRLTLIYRTRTM